MYYDYNTLLQDVARWKALGLNVFSIGRSFSGREIPCVFMGKTSGNNIIIQGGIHARESVTSKLISMQIDFTFNHLDAINGGIYFVPMVNVDGVELALKGLESVNDYFTRQFLAKINGESLDFSMWKANQNAVDLNVNFDARWGTGALNVFEPAPANYIGEYPVSELENKALCELTKMVEAKGTISYHAKGDVIFWDFHQTGETLVRDRSIASVISQLTGYPLLPSGNSAGGYKDWCIEKLGIPALTIEVGNSAYTYLELYNQIDTIFEANKDVPVVFLNEINAL